MHCGFHFICGTGLAGNHKKKSFPSRSSEKTKRLQNVLRELLFSNPSREKIFPPSPLLLSRLCADLVFFLIMAASGAPTLAHPTQSALIQHTIVSDAGVVSTLELPADPSQASDEHMMALLAHIPTSKLLLMPAMLPGQPEEQATVFQVISERYRVGNDVPPNRAEELRYMRCAADLGFPELQTRMAYLYYGEGDYSAAFGMLELATKSGPSEAPWYSEALCSLAELYHEGKGVEKNEQKAVQLLELPVREGFPAAQYQLAGYALAGTGTPQDPPLAAALLAKAATTGHSDAQYDLGAMYCEGKGVPQDYQRAREYFEMAASDNNPAALLKLSQMYVTGLGTLQDVRCGKRYLKQAQQWCFTDNGNGGYGPKHEPAVHVESTDGLDYLKHTCATCYNVAQDLKLCANCKGPRYCDSSCQKQHWPAHKQVCRLYRHQARQQQTRQEEDIPVTATKTGL